MSSDPDGELPDGWVTVPVGEIAQPSNLKLDPSERPDAPYLSLEHIESETGRILGTGLGADATSTKAVFRSGDVLYGKLRPYLNKVCVPDFDGICSTDILVLQPSAAVLSRFLELFLRQRSVVEYANARAAGIQLPRVNFAALARLIVPLPPLAEQRRIAAKVDSLLEQVQEVGDSLGHTAALLARFRQSTLVAASSGKLTEPWCNRPQRDLAAELVNQISCDHGLTPPDVHADSPLPEGWCRVTLGFLARPTLRNQPHITSGSRGWARYVSNNGAYFIRSENISTDYLRLSDSVRVVPPPGAEADRTEVRPRDLLLTITGSNFGRTAVVPEDAPKAYVSQHVAIIRLHERVLPEYIWTWMRSPGHGLAQLKKYSYGDTKPGLNLEQVKSVWIDLPSLAEQREIVRRVEASFKLTDDIERSVAAAKSRADKLAQAILTRAFRGELVPTEAELAQAQCRDYEKADQLLARIRDAAARANETRKTTISVKKGKPTMRKADRQAVEDAIRAMPKDRFCFDDLHGQFPGDYERLRESVFSLLEDSGSALTQVFDEKAQAMLFVRRSR